MNLSAEQKQTHIENRLVVAKGEGVGKDGLGVWGQHMQTSIYGMDKQGAAQGTVFSSCDKL